LRLSPDGRRTAYTVASNDRAANETRSAIWMLDLATGESVPFTRGEQRDADPRWSPDGTLLAFTSTRAGKEPQLFVMAADGGEARQLTWLTRGVKDPFWSADGTWIGCATEVRSGDNPEQPDRRTRAKHERAEQDEAEEPRVITRLVYRWDGKGYFLGRTHLFRVYLADGRVESLTEGDYDNGDGACSPNGRYLAFISDRTHECDANMATDLYLLDLAARDLRRLTDGQQTVSLLSWSPDGTRLAFVARGAVAAHAIYHARLLVADARTGALTTVFASTQREASSGVYADVPAPLLSAPIWSPAGDALLFLSKRGGTVELLHVPASGGAVETVLTSAGLHLQYGALASNGKHLIVARSDPSAPSDLREYDLDHPDGEPRQVIALNRDLLAEREVVAPERFTLTSFDGQEIEAWLYRPRHSTAPAPLVLRIHGGPHSAYGETFHFEAQVPAGMGYAVLMPNPRGSVGYGEAFAQACDADWAGGDYRDLMVALDAALARGGLDPARLAVMGASYGGYMTNWIVGQTDRFKAAVSINGIANLHSMFGTTDRVPFTACEVRR
jgi:dipeptidyl aminopeptidase/acylaminoacyl peptidase